MRTNALLPIGCILLVLFLFSTAYVPMKRLLVEVGVPLYVTVALLLTGFFVAFVLSVRWAWRSIRK